MGPGNELSDESQGLNSATFSEENCNRSDFLRGTILIFEKDLSSYLTPSKTFETHERGCLRGLFARFELAGDPMPFSVVPVVPWSNSDKTE